MISLEVMRRIALDARLRGEWRHVSLTRFTTIPGDDRAVVPDGYFTKSDLGPGCYRLPPGYEIAAPGDPLLAHALATNHGVEPPEGAESMTPPPLLAWDSNRRLVYLLPVTWEPYGMVYQNEVLDDCGCIISQARHEIFNLRCAIIGIAAIFAMMMVALAWVR